MGSLYGEGASRLSEKPRCKECNKLLALWVTAPWGFQCPRCKTVTTEGPVPEGFNV